MLLESTLALLAAVLILLALPLQPYATHKELYSYQILSDFIILTQNKHYDEVNGFANGNQQAKAKLKAAYSNAINAMGGYCLQLEAKGKKIQVNCEGIAQTGGFGKNSKNTFSEPVTFYDGNEFYEATFTLTA